MTYLTLSQALETRQMTAVHTAAMDTRSIFSLTDTQLHNAHLAQNLPKSYADNLGIFFKDDLAWPCTLPLAFSSYTSTPVLGIRDVLVRIRIRRPVPLTNEWIQIRLRIQLQIRLL
jgi:hypothetical protein